jgi:hypothetical protein
MLSDDLQSMAETLSAACAEGVFLGPAEIVCLVARLNAASAEAHALHPRIDLASWLTTIRERAVLAFFAALPWLRLAWSFGPWR